VLYGQVEGEAAVGFEHVIQEGGTQLCKVSGVEVVLQPDDKDRDLVCYV